MDYFNSDYIATGKSFETYEAAAKPFDDNTKMIKFEPGTMMLMHIQKIESNNIYLRYLQPFSYMKDMAGNLTLGKAAYIRTDTVKDCIDEFIPETTIFKLDGQSIFIDSHFNKTFSDKVTDLGGSFVTTPSIIRDAALCHLAENDRIPEGKFLVRKRNNRMKAFGFYTERFKRVDFTALSDYAKTRNDLSLLKWKIDQDSAQIYLDLKDYKTFGLIPGVMLETSDTSMAPTQAVPYWRTKGGECFYLEAFKIKHSTSVSTNDLKEIVDQAVASHNVNIDKFIEVKDKFNSKIISGGTMAVKVKELTNKMDIAKIMGKRKSEEFIKAIIEKHKDEKDVTEFSIIKDMIGFQTILDISPRYLKIYKSEILLNVLAA